MKDYELLEAQARMMRLAEKYGIKDWRKLVRDNNGRVIAEYNHGRHGLYADIDYQFAIGVVEGKPVFEVDELYLEDGRKFKALLSEEQGDVIVLDAGDGYRCYSAVRFVSWNPPKPKTVIVELMVDDAEYFANAPTWGSAIAGYERVFSACRKALEDAK